MYCNWNLVLGKNSVSELGLERTVHITFNSNSSPFKPLRHLFLWNSKTKQKTKRWPTFCGMLQPRNCCVTFGHFLPMSYIISIIIQLKHHQKSLLLLILTSWNIRSPLFPEQFWGWLWDRSRGVRPRGWVGPDSGGRGPQPPILTQPSHSSLLQTNHYKMLDSDPGGRDPEHPILTQPNPSYHSYCTMHICITRVSRPRFQTQGREISGLQSWPNPATHQSYIHITTRC